MKSCLIKGINRFSIAKEILIIPKVGKMGHFCALNEHFLTFFLTCLLQCSEIAPDGRH